MSNIIDAVLNMVNYKNNTLLTNSHGNNRGLCKFLSVKSIIHEKGPSMVYKQKVEFPLPIFGFATN